VRFPIEITVEGGTADLRTGMTANAEIACARVDDVLWVPNDALFQKEDDDDAKGKWFVAVVTGEEDGKLTTEDREVTKGLASDARIEITSGLEEGDKVELGKAGVPERKKIEIQRESERRAEEEGD
jgi:multidrug efflux pump subunit AcrA (membrane-fusion protein)